MAHSGSGSRIIKNTAILYARIVITVLVSLYTTRIVLNGLGETDYGIYNLVAGVVVMLSFLNSALATSTQRYLSFHQGRQDAETQRRVFNNSLLLHIFLGLVIVIALEVSGLFLFGGFLNIPADRISAAKSIYHFMAVTVFFSFIAAPFNGALNAHENMLWSALVSIVEVILKLSIALLLFVVVVSDKLEFYGYCMALISVISLILYAVYCFRKYEECKLRLSYYFDKTVMKELTSFAGWSLFGAACGVSRVQGTAIILNLFFGSIVNAAYGVANQVSSQMNFLSSTLLQAINPQIMKSEGGGDRKKMLRLSMMASKFGFFLFSLVAIPTIFEMQTILELWLENVPKYSVTFCRLLLLGIMANQLTIGLQSAVQATGKIKVYQLVVGCILLFNLPVSYVLLKIGFPAYYGLLSFIAIELIACVFRLFFLRSLANLSISEYINKVFVREFIPVMVCVATCYVLTHFIVIPFRFLLTYAISCLLYLITIYLVGLEKEELQLIDNLRLKIFKK